MSVDTIDRGNRTRGYMVWPHLDLSVLVALPLAQFARSLSIDTKRWLFRTSLAVDIEALPHKHTTA